METTAVADKLTFDLYAMYTQDHIPVYRLFVDGYLMTERDYKADSFNDQYIKEVCPILLKHQPTELKIEWYEQPFTYEVKNIILENTTLKTIHILEKNKDVFIANLEHIE